MRLPSDISSQDTFERIFAILNPEAWQAKFLQWTKTSALAELAEGEDEILAVDGKSARGSTREGLAALHMVSVGSSQRTGPEGAVLSKTFEVVLAQQHVTDNDKSNEITVSPELLEVVNPAGAVVTADAMGTQKQFAWTVREYHEDYLLALENNHPTLFEDIKDFFAYADKADWDLEHSYTQTTERGHGRVETRPWPGFTCA
ncbi:hypothetical protein BH24DEI2_BH24DEI2_03380 [soil metagenome]